MTHFLDFWLIYALLSQNVVVAIFALFPQIFLDWILESPVFFFTFRMYAWHSWILIYILCFWNYWDYWGSSSPLTSLDLCDMNDGLEGRMVVQEEGETLAKVFSDRILSPQAVGTGAVRGTKAFTFYSFSNSHHLPSCSSTNNWSLWQDQSSFSRLTNSGFSMFLMVIYLQPTWATLHVSTTNWVNHLVDSQCTWRQSNSGHLLT